MITGYNTDVRHGELVFHVQTEDKGLANPSIESLIYVGGQVVASRRSSYAQLLAEGKDEKEIVALMDHQHRTMIAAIRHGKFDGKLEELNLKSPAPAAGAAPLASMAGAEGATLARAPMAPPSPPSPAAPSAPMSTERTLDQVILEYLTNEADQEQLVLFLEEESNLALGCQAQLVLRTRSSKSGMPVVAAQVSVKMISTVSDPKVLAMGKTDDQGLAALTFDIPAIGRGTAALIITAVGAIGRAELKHLL